MSPGWNYRGPPRSYRADSAPKPRHYEGLRAQKRARTTREQALAVKTPASRQFLRFAFAAAIPCAIHAQNGSVAP
eukprot:2627265-Lingulodinium_polyedra.AAC.1